MNWIKNYWRSILFLCFTIFLFTYKFSGGGGGSIPHLDKVVHFGLFFVLSFSFLYDTNKYNAKKGVQKLWLIIIASVVYGILVEVFQGAFLPWRSASGYDVLFDALGVVTGTLSYIGYKNSRLFKPAVR